jgi:hypothetical protein
VDPAVNDPAPLRHERPAAHRRLGLVAVLYAYRAIAAVLIALPLAALLGGPVASYPRGHAELFDPGAVMLVESLRLTRRAWPAVGWSAGALATVAILAGVFPLGALLAGLGREGRLPAPFLLEKAWSNAPTLGLLYGLFALAQAGAIGLVIVLGGKAIGAAALRPPADDLAFVALFTVAGSLGLMLGLLRDLASVAAVRGQHGLYVATSDALVCARRAGGRALAAWAWRALLGVAGLACAAWLAPALAGAAAPAIALGVLLHQGAVAGATFAHASWLAAAMRLYDGVVARPERIGEAGHEH